jgi:hypothetical protein
MEKEVIKRYSCKECEKTFSRRNSLKRHSTSFAHTKGIPCSQCKKHFSRTDDLSLHLQKQHGLAFKDAGRKAGSSRRKAKRKRRDNEDLDEMAAEIERALLNPSKATVSPDKVVATITVPKDLPFTISAPTPDIPAGLEDLVAGLTSGPTLPVAYTIVNSNSLEAISKVSKDDNTKGLGTILSIVDIAPMEASTSFTLTDEEILKQASALSLPLFDLSEWEKMERFLKEHGTTTSKEAEGHSLTSNSQQPPTDAASAITNTAVVAMTSDDLTRELAEEAPPSLPNASIQLQSVEEPPSVSTSESTHSIKAVEFNEDEPSTSSRPEPSNRGIPATWLQVEDLWLSLFQCDETKALTTALDFVKQLQNISK